MWKVLVGFAIFAAIAIFVLTKSGGNVDLGGEKHEVVPHGAESASAAQAPGSSASAAPASASATGHAASAASK